MMSAVGRLEPMGLFQQPASPLSGAARLSSRRAFVTKKGRLEHPVKQLWLPQLYLAGDHFGR